MSGISNRPVYTIRIAAQMIGVHQQTLRAYEREGLLTPARSAGRQRLYSDDDIARLRVIRRLIDDLGVNLAGADIILRLRTRITELERENRRLRGEIQRQRDQQLPAVRPPIIRTRERQSRERRS